MAPKKLGVLVMIIMQLEYDDVLQLWSGVSVCDSEMHLIGFWFTEVKHIMTQYFRRSKNLCIWRRSIFCQSLDHQYFIYFHDCKFMCRDRLKFRKTCVFPPWFLLHLCFPPINAVDCSNYLYVFNLSIA